MAKVLHYFKSLASSCLRKQTVQRGPLPKKYNTATRDFIFVKKDSFPDISLNKFSGKIFVFNFHNFDNDDFYFVKILNVNKHHVVKKLEMLPLFQNAAQRTTKQKNKEFEIYEICDAYMNTEF